MVGVDPQNSEDPSLGNGHYLLVTNVAIRCYHSSIKAFKDETFRPMKVAYRPQSRSRPRGSESFALKAGDSMVATFHM